MDSDNTQQPNPVSETRISAEQSKKKFSWPLFCKQMLAACLLGCLLGTIASNFINYCIDKTENYMLARREREIYGRELPNELHTIITSYKMLRSGFYRDVPAPDYLNGALAGINIACDLAEKETKTDKQDKGKQTAASSPAPSPSASVSPSPGAEPSPSPGASRHSAAKKYQEYAKKNADALHNLKIKNIYPLLTDQKQSEQELLKQFTTTVLKAMDDGLADKEKICYGALCGMTAATADPYSTVLNKDETRELNEDLGNEDFCGIGIYIEADVRNHKLTVIEPIEGTPAAKAGLQTGDCITEIDGRSTDDMNLELAAKAIRGPEGSTVSLKIARPHTKEFTLKIQRQKVSKKSVTSKMLHDRTGYVRLRYFGRDTGSDCRLALRSLIEKDAQAIVLDLRNNPGGAIDESVIVASQFLEKNQLVTSVETPRTERHEVYKAIGGAIAPLPLAVLINSYSASASEIVAGALKDNKRGILVGETTFGKGSVQVIRKVGCEMELKYTIAHYLTPALRDINLKGIEPDIVCEAPYSNRLGDSDDKQLQAALKQLALQRQKQ